VDFSSMVEVSLGWNGMIILGLEAGMTLLL
jgi:hypothetical protein